MQEIGLEVAFAHLEVALLLHFPLHVILAYLHALLTGTLLRLEENLSPGEKTEHRFCDILGWGMIYVWIFFERDIGDLCVEGHSSEFSFGGGVGGK